MEIASLIRHYQSASAGEDQGWHPHVVVRWLFLIIPLLYFCIIEFKVLKRVLANRQKYWVSTQARNTHFLILLGIYEIILFCIGLYVAITDTWSTKQWVLWAAVLIFVGLLLLAYSTHLQIFIIVALLSIICFFFSQWLFAQTKDMNANFWKHLLRNAQGFNTAMLMFTSLISFERNLVYFLGWNQFSQSKFFWIVGILLSIGFTLLNALVYGPFVDVIGFIIGCIACFIAAYLFQTHEIKDQIIRH